MKKIFQGIPITPPKNFASIIKNKDIYQFFYYFVLVCTYFTSTVRDFALEKLFCSIFGAVGLIFSSACAHFDELPTFNFFSDIFVFKYTYQNPVPRYNFSIKKLSLVIVIQNCPKHFMIKILQLLIQLSEIVAENFDEIFY